MSNISQLHEHSLYAIANYAKCQHLLCTTNQSLLASYKNCQCTHIGTYLFAGKC